MHSRGLVHRDVKLENWVYEGARGRSRLKLVDFGAAARLEPGEQLLAPAGTLEYRSPV